jgi:hypothetical protein
MVVWYVTTVATFGKLDEKLRPDNVQVADQEILR